MCKISDKLKLCTCRTENVQSLKHYWVLNRHEALDSYVLGSIIPPADIEEQVEKYNLNTLRKLLNDGNCFDVKLDHQENDILELHFTCQQKLDTENQLSDSGNYIVYAFKFTNGKWRKTKYDPFGNNLTTVQGGKILTPLVK
jgi:hypothetical protein